MKKIYLAARYSRRLELCEYKKQLESMGYIVTSRWLNGSHQISNTGLPLGDHGEALVEEGNTEAADALRRHFVEEDVADVLASDLVISFTEEPRSNHSRGGRHVEFGIAIGADIDRWVVGHKENLFHYLNDVRFFSTWETCLNQLRRQ